jgi:Bacterial HORMA domain 2
MATQAYAYTQGYTRTHSITFLSDNLRNTLREVIHAYGISPDRLMQDWLTIERGIKRWLETGHLKSVVVEFYKPGSSVASARWDFPAGYEGSGADDDMWRDKAYLRQLIAKSARPTLDCIYRITLSVKAGAPDVAGFSDTTFLSTGSLAAREAGTVIATRHMTAAAVYWRQSSC